MLIFLYTGAKRGLLRSAVYIVLIAAAFFVSWFTAEAAAPYIYDSFIKERILSSFSENASSKNPAGIVLAAVSGGGYGVEMTSDEVEAIIEEDDDFYSRLASEIRKNGSPDSEEEIRRGVEQSVTPAVLDALMGDVISSEYIKNALETVGGAAERMSEVAIMFITGTKEDAAVYAEENLVAPIAVWLIKAVVFILMMFILRLIINPLADAFRLANKIPLIGPINALLGGALGALEGVVFIFVLALAVKALIGFTGDSLIFFNSETVLKSWIFSRIYSFDLVLAIGG